MKIRRLFLFALMYSSALFSQLAWHILPGIPGSVARYDDVFFLNPQLGWAADGWGATVYKTTDGGTTWNLQLSLSNIYFRNIEFLDENTGFLGTLSNQFYKTNDGGATWQLVTNIPGPIEAICGLDVVGNTVYGCGAYFSPAYIIKSSDGGTNWQYFDMSQYADSLVEVLFVDENTGYASGGNASGGMILKTTDGGNSWAQIYNTGIPGEYVWKLQRLFSNTDVMFGSVESVAPLTGKLIKSVDGGITWNAKDAPDTDIQAVGFITENHGWMGGHHTGFLETFDSGNTWQDTGLGGSLNRIQIFDGNLAYCSGVNIYKFSDVNLGVPQFNPLPPKDNLSVRITPNPVENNLEFTVDFKSQDHILIRLFDNQGKLLNVLQKETITTAGKKSYSFPFPYPSGVYYLNFHNDTAGRSEKILKR